MSHSDITDSISLKKEFVTHANHFMQVNFQGPQVDPQAEHCSMLESIKIKITPQEKSIGSHVVCHSDIASTLKSNCTSFGP